MTMMAIIVIIVAGRPMQLIHGDHTDDDADGDPYADGGYTTRF